MYHHQRMFRHQWVLRHLCIVLRSILVVLRRFKTVHRAQSAEKLLQGRGQCPESCRHIGPVSVTTVGRHYYCTQYRSERWVDRGGDIGMPVGPGTGRHRTSGEGSAVFAYRVDFREFTVAAEYHVRGCQISEVPRKFNVLAMVEVMVSAAVSRTRLSWRRR